MYKLLDSSNNNLGYFEVEISSDYISTCPVLPLIGQELETLKFSRVSKTNVYLSNGYKLVKVSG
jgi:hypothetical protein